MVQELLDEHKKSNSEYPVSIGNVSHIYMYLFREQKRSDRGRATLIITDRAMDMYAPLLHEFTYQAMCQDLLRIEGGTKYMCVRFKMLMPLSIFIQHTLKVQVPVSYRRS